MNLSSTRRLSCCVWVLLLPACGRAGGQQAVTARGNCVADKAGVVSCSGGQIGIADGVAPPPPGAVQVGVFSTGGIGFGLQGEAEIVRKEPYQAEAVTEIRQTLANGTHIAQTITATVARDSEGRTLRSQKLQENGRFFSIFRGDANSASSSAEAEPPTLTTIFDPVAREHIDYTSDVKIARVLPIDISPGKGEKNAQTLSVSGRSSGAITAFATPGSKPLVVPGGEPGPGLMVMRFAGDEQNMKTESLGTRTIEGIDTIGTLKTWTIPVGAIGNDRALVTTEETWYSPKLKLVLLSTRDDPRFGDTIYSLKNIRRAEPDKSLFRIPAGYDVEKMPPPPPPSDLPGSRMPR